MLDDERSDSEAGWGRSTDSVFVHGADTEFDRGPIVAPGSPRLDEGERGRDVRSKEGGQVRAGRRLRSRRRTRHGSGGALRRAACLIGWMVVAVGVLGAFADLVESRADRMGEVSADEEVMQNGLAASDTLEYADEVLSDAPEYDAGPEYDVPIEFSAQSYVENGGSRVPVEVTGTDASGEAVEEVVFVDEVGFGIFLPDGSYTLRILGSPISWEGDVYAVDTERTYDVEIAGDAPASVLLDFAEVPSDEVTDEQLEDAYRWAADGGCYSSGTADLLRSMVEDRRAAAQGALT